MTEEERIDEIIRSTASDYNRPPAVPRDEMWSAIQTARQTPRLHITAGGATHSSPRRLSTRFAWIGMAAAAALLVATGVGIGRWTSRSSSPVARQNPVAVIAEAPVAAPPSSSEVTAGPMPSATGSTPVRGDDAPAASRRSRDEIRRNPVVKGNGILRPVGGSAFASNPTDQRPASPAVYQVATARHLADAEALLTSFSVGSRDARMDAQFAEWARGLLSNTRLLLDSPAGDDPRRAKLLQDLELVLAQIAQLSPTAAPQDRELIQGSIQEGHVMTRLRTAIPAGSPRDILER